MPTIVRAAIKTCHKERGLGEEKRIRPSLRWRQSTVGAAFGVA
jgi:hypothetical protein